MTEARAKVKRCVGEQLVRRDAMLRRTRWPDQETKRTRAWTRGLKQLENRWAIGSARAISNPPRAPDGRVAQARYPTNGL